MQKLLAFLLLWISLTVASTDGGINVTKDEIVIDFPNSLQFKLAAESAATIEKVSLHYGTNAVACQSGVAQQDLEFDPAQSVDLEWTWDLLRSRALPPGAQVWWQWEISTTGGERLLTERQTVTIQDERHKWKQVQVSGGLVTVQWYAGDQGFGERLARFTQAGLDRLENDLGLDLARPVLITIYPTPAEVQEALLVTYEWTGGVSIAEYSAILIGAGEQDLDWLQGAIPHELAHLLVDGLVFNCKGTRLPTWLNEGLAKVAEGGISPEQHDQVVAAVQSSKLPPLHNLENGFSPYSAQADLEYQLSGAVVAYLIEQHGSGSLLELIQAVQGGQKIDPALEQVYGFDTGGLETAWRQSQGLAPLPTSSPDQQNLPTATRIPTLALYTSVVQVKPTSTPTAAPSPTPPPATVPPSQTALLAPSSAALPQPTPAGRTASPGCPLSLGLGILIVAVAFHARRRHP